ncbi:MAG: hypothetical protein ACYCRH_04030 [Acidiferrobacteraceae bacterium]
MRILFWLLLAANAGLWMWTRWEAPLPERPRTPIHAHELELLSAPGVSLTPRFTSTSPQSSGGTAPDESASAWAPAPAPPLTCYQARTLAPARLVPIQQRLKTMKLGYRTRTRARTVYQVAALPLSQQSYAAFRHRLRVLKITGTYRFTTHHGVRVSFGVFRNRKDAVRETARLLQRGLRVRIRAMKRPITSLTLAPIAGALPPALARLSPLLRPVPCTPPKGAARVRKDGGSSSATGPRPQSGSVPHRPHATAR